MEIVLKLKPEKTLIIPFNYFYQLQSCVYSMLGEISESDFWHDIGYGEYVKYKGFCFSGLKGKYTINHECKKLMFTGPFYFEVRSAVFEFIDAFQRAVEWHPFIKLFDTGIDIVEASLHNTHFKDGITFFNATSPVVIHSELEDGHTLFLTPNDEEYFVRICNNIANKYRTIKNKEPEDFMIRQAGELKKVVTKYKNTWISGYQGPFEIKSSARMKEFIYSTGLGEKNSQGFGFIESFKRPFH